MAQARGLSCQKGTSWNEALQAKHRDGHDTKCFGDDLKF